MIKFKQRATASAVAALIAAGGLTAFCVYAVAEDTPPAVAAPAAPQVDVAEVVARRIVDWQNYSGRLEAIDRVDIRPLVSGRIVQVHFEDGSLVKKGDPLFTIDPRPYAAEVSRAQAQVTAAQARASWTGNDMARADRLLADTAVARRDYDE